MQTGVRVATIWARTPVSTSGMITMRTPVFAVAAMLATLSAPVLLTPEAQAQSVGQRDPLVERLQVRANAAEQSVQRLTGRVEQMGFQNNQLRQALEDQNGQIEQLKSTISALEARLQKLESLANSASQEAANAANEARTGEFTLVGPTDPATKEALAEQRDVDQSLETKGAVPTTPASLTLDETPDGLFKQAKNLLVRGDYPAAEKAFTEYLGKYPDNERAAEAQYWLGESLLIQEAYPEATEAYVTLVSTWPEAEKAPDALVKLGRSLRMMGQTTEACEALNEVNRLYPNAGPVTRSSVAREKDRAKCGGA